MRSLLLKLRVLYRSSPTFRFALRQAVVFAAGYAVEAFRAGEPLDLSALVVGAILAGITATLGASTPLEPFVGRKADTVEVPAPPADPEPASGS